MSKIGYVKNLGNGKYLLRLSLGFDDFGKRIQPSRTIDAESDRQAEKALMDFYNGRGKLISDRSQKSPQTLLGLYNEWMDNHVKPNLRGRTREYYEGLWDTHVKPFGKAKLKSFSPKMVYKIINGLEDKPRTRQGVYGMLKAMFSKAVIWGYMLDNPCNRVDPPKYTAKEKVVYTPEQIEKIIKIVSNEEPKYQALFYFAILCGMRREEIVGLKWEDIDFKEGTFEIKRAATDLKGIGTFGGETKNKKSIRKLTLPETLVPILKKIRAWQTSQQLSLRDKWKSEGWIFTKWNGSIMCVDTPSWWWCNLKKKHSDILPQQTFHTLRHTLATYMIEDKVPISTVAGVLGHSQISTTVNIYTHVIEDSKRSAMKSYEQRIIGVGKSGEEKTVQ